MARLRIKRRRVVLNKFREKLDEAERELMPVTVSVPVDPTYPREGGNDGDRQLHDEQQVARVELMMLKGVRSRRALMTLLDVEDHRLMDRYIKRVHARWELGGTSQDFARHRGESLARLDLIESEMWAKLSNLDQKISPQISLNYLKALLDVSRQRADMLGLTPKVIAHIGAMDDSVSEVTNLTSQQDRIARVLSRIQGMITDRMKVIEHVPESDS
ncbi:MAG: hypothetical protein KJZ83_00455 [Burkholderiaceae bacterium]|nr:hypothetical protein [Burkholderiaceae bacterium]